MIMNRAINMLLLCELTLDEKMIFLAIFLHIERMNDIHQLYFEILFRFLKQQNERLLHEIAVRENIPEKELAVAFLPSQRLLRQYLRS